ncbi:hypothetical protein GXW83_08235 [Streptacidiphilus sp. PB12-B1b]|uniref:hypothetical protein n=1 Tax=Streptacidiphilus sp. PB12-B1b TaxID=2705012 RepID=UPI0015FCBF6B|nr:hypothetical protein [Streptacidiphilus sp. PB12-B1b]QMU75729.1 hypothetical protein GXW83_08235 [Streptacidiphilus sp. PB12-B1b]
MTTGEFMRKSLLTAGVAFLLVGCGSSAVTGHASAGRPQTSSSSPLTVTTAANQFRDLFAAAARSAPKGFDAQAAIERQPAPCPAGTSMADVTMTLTPSRTGWTDPRGAAEVFLTSHGWTVGSWGPVATPLVKAVRTWATEDGRTVDLYYGSLTGVLTLDALTSCLPGTPAPNTPIQ